MTSSSHHSPQNHERLQEILAEYLELTESGNKPDRESFLARNPELADELAAFLDDRDSIEKFVAPMRDKKKTAVEIEPTIGTDEATPPEPGDVVRYFGDYELLEEIARGGMGVVYKARQVSLNRIVALKMILAGQLASEQDVQRFHTEAEAAANLDHPNIVPIYEVGEHEGLHYFSMGFVDGHSLAERLADGPLEPREAAELTKKLADAIAYAHEQGVIHRDLKPANVLLDKNGEPRVTDFGLAKRTEADSGLTGTGQILGTPSFMPPEQAGGQTNKVSPAADVYSLGAVLYNLLTGRPPFQAANPMETLMQVLHKEPVSPRELNENVPRDLETICLKCLNKEVDGRYPSATEVSDELDRFLKGVPIHARPTGRLERCWRWARRRPAAAALLVVTTLAVMACIGIGVAVVYQQRLEEANDQLANTNTRVEQANDQLATANSSLEQSKDQLEQSLYLRRISLALLKRNEGDHDEAERLLQECPERWRHWEWYYVYRLCHHELHTLKDQGDVREVVYSPNGKYLAIVNGSKIVVRDADSLKQLFLLPGYCLAFSPDSKRIATGDYNLIARVWDIESGREAVTFKGHAKYLADFRSRSAAPIVGDIAFSPDGTRIASCDGRQLKLWDAANGQEILSLEEEGNYELSTLAFSPDGKRIAVGGLAPFSNSDEMSPAASVWDLASGEKLFVLPQHRQVHSVVFSPDGDRVVTAGMGGTVIWDAEQGKKLVAIKPGFLVRSLAFDAEGKRIVAGSGKTILVWDSTSGEELQAFHGHQAQVTSVAFHPSGDSIASGSEDKTVKISSTRRRQDPVLEFEGEGTAVASLAFHPDCRTVVAAHANGIVKQWDIETGKRVAEFNADQSDNKMTAIALSNDAQRVAVSQQTPLPGRNAGHRPVVNVWAIASRKKLLSLNCNFDSAVSHITFSQNGERIAAADVWRVSVWNTEDGKPLVTFKGHEGGSYDISCLAFSTDGRKIASTAGELIVWDAETGEEVSPRQATFRRCVAINRNGQLSSIGGSSILSPDGKRIVKGDNKGKISIRDAVGGREALIILKGHDAPITTIAFSPDGKYIASGSEDGITKVWMAASKDELEVDPEGGTSDHPKEFRPIQETVVMNNDSEAQIGGEWSFVVAPNGEVTIDETKTTLDQLEDLVRKRVESSIDRRTLLRKVRVKVSADAHATVGALRRAIEACNKVGIERFILHMNKEDYPFFMGRNPKDLAATQQAADAYFQEVVTDGPVYSRSVGINGNFTPSLRVQLKANVSGELAAITVNEMGSERRYTQESELQMQARAYLGDERGPGSIAEDARVYLECEAGLHVKYLQTALIAVSYYADSKTGKRIQLFRNHNISIFPFPERPIAKFEVEEFDLKSPELPSFDIEDVPPTHLPKRK